MSEFSEKRRKVCAKIWRTLTKDWNEILRKKIPTLYQYQVSKSVETVPITFVTAKVYNRWLSTFFYEPVLVIRDIFLPCTKLSKGRGRGPKYLVEGPRSSPKYFRGRFFARTYFLRSVRVLIAQSIRARALSGAKKKSLNGDLFLLSFSFSLLFFISFSFRTVSARFGESSHQRRSIVRLRGSMQNSRFYDKKVLETTTTGNFKYRILFLESSVGRDWIPSLCTFCTYSWRSWLVCLFFKSQSLIYLPTLEYATEVLFKR